LKQLLTILSLFSFLSLVAQKDIPWVPDNGDGTYSNPVIHADYSDPDAIRVGDDFYMIASSFNAYPGLPILQSKDLVNWKLVGYALRDLYKELDFDKVQHGNGVWAPSIRFHQNEFYIYFPDPDKGLFLTKARTITGPWSTPKLVDAGKGLIDPCPLWDEDGRTWLVHAYAGSRAGFKSIIVVKEMNAAGDSIIGKPILLYDGHGIDPTIEGPKIYKRNNYYYIFAPAGGVSTGWQLVLRSRNILGPYERKVVMDQGASVVNGPHQGAWVTTVNNENWFLHFQDKGAYGRIVHLQPMVWKNDWPVIGVDKDGDGKGEPLERYKKPFSRQSQLIQSPVVSDEFDKPIFESCWQWQAREQEGWAFGSNNGKLRMNCSPWPDSISNRWNQPNMLLQKLPAEKFTATTKISFSPAFVNDRTGIIVFGLDYAYLHLVKKADGIYLALIKCEKADKGNAESEKLFEKIAGTTIYLRINIQAPGVAGFSYSEDGINFRSLPEIFTMKEGKWVGAKIGLLTSGSTITNDGGFADIDWFHITK
jgi:beta-xylosidase